MKKLAKIFLTKYMMFVCIFVASAYTIPTSKEHLQKQINYYSQFSLTDKMLAFAIRDMEIQYPELVYRQVILESGNLKSKLAERQNNLFGMKMPRKRFTFACDKGKHNYAKYESWAHSVADYKIYQGDRIIKNYESFLTRRKYSETKDYIKRLSKIKISNDILEILKS